MGESSRSLPPAPFAQQAHASFQNEAESFVMFAGEKKITDTDYQEVMLWQTPANFQAPPRVLPLNGAPVWPKLELSGPPAPDRATSRLNRPAVNQSQTDFRRPSAVSTDWRLWLRRGLVGTMALSLLIMASVVLPDLYFRFQSDQITASVGGSTQLEEKKTELAALATPAPTPTPPTLPPVDPNLPVGSWVRIPKIGVEATVSDDTDPDAALEKGAWMVPDFGRPHVTGEPTIIASHRYGWVWWWQTDFGRKNSFYYLPDMAAGDRVEVIQDQRKYTYEIYAKEEGELISDYTADLILYTCKFLNSPVRYFVYAKQIPPETVADGGSQVAADLVPAL